VCDRGLQGAPRSDLRSCTSQSARGALRESTSQLDPRWRHGACSPEGSMGNSSDLLPLVGPSNDPALRSFLLAQIQWEHYHASRIRLVHALAGGGLCLWLLLSVAPGPPDPLHRGALAAWAICFLATGFAAVMEHRWSRRRRRLAALMEESGVAGDKTGASATFATSDDSLVPAPTSEDDSSGKQRRAHR
jgi:hypothetical protein